MLFASWQIIKAQEQLLPREVFVARLITVSDCPSLTRTDGISWSGKGSAGFNNDTLISFLSRFELCERNRCINGNSNDFFF